MSAPRAMILTAPGVNCEIETGFMFEQAGADVEQVHITEWAAGHVSLSDYEILALPGGFSYGDDIAAGRIMGVKMRTNGRFADELNQFMADGKVGIGICNGFQVAVETGLVPSGRVEAERDKTVALAANNSGLFDDRWGRLRVEESISKYISAASLGGVIELPWAHGEGRFLLGTDDQRQALIAAGQVVFRYATKTGQIATDFPNNPNGSPFGIAGVCDPTGQFLGMMPHPERFVDAMQHPDVRRRDVGPAAGLVIARSMVDYARQL